MFGGKRWSAPASARVRVPLLAGLAVIAPAILAASVDTVAAGISVAPGRSMSEPRFLVYYGVADNDEIERYDLIVLDSDVAPAVLRRRSGATFLGYLSLGEVHGGRHYFSEVDKDGLLLAPNPNWPDARLVDMRSRRWHDRVIGQLVPAILARGFQGVFIDTLDNAEALEAQDPVRFAGMVEGAARLVRAINRCFPDMPVMINRGYAVLPRVAGAFHMLLGESVRATFITSTSTYEMVPEDGYAWQVRRMREARERDPRVRLFSLDYWNPEDRDGIARLYALQRANGFIPYVGTFDLTRIVPEP